MKIDDGVAELHPDHHEHDADERRVRAAEPVVLQAAEADGLEDDVERAVLRPQDPADHDRGDGDGEDLRQVVGSAQEAREPPAELLADEVEEHRGQQQAEQGGQDDHGHDHPDAVEERGPELGILQQGRPVVEADEDRGQDAAPRGEAEVDVPDQRNEDDDREQHESGDEVEPESAAATASAAARQQGVVEPDLRALRRAGRSHEGDGGHGCSSG